jgi:hypothetical protein
VAWLPRPEFGLDCLKVEWVQGLSVESQGQNLALTVFNLNGFKNVQLKIKA